jgi:hypothetical protein
MGTVPDSRAMVVAIPATHANGLQLTLTEVVLRNASWEKLKTLEVFEALVGLCKISNNNVIYVVEGLYVEANYEGVGAPSP